MNGFFLRACVCSTGLHSSMLPQAIWPLGQMQPSDWSGCTQVRGEEFRPYQQKCFSSDLHILKADDTHSQKFWLLEGIRLNHPLTTCSKLNASEMPHFGTLKCLAPVESSTKCLLIPRHWWVRDQKQWQTSAMYVMITRRYGAKRKVWRVVEDFE